MCNKQASLTAKIRKKVLQDWLQNKFFQTGKPKKCIILSYLCRKNRVLVRTCLLKAFTRADPKSVKRQSSHQCLIVLLVSALKEACKMLVESTQGLWKNLD